LESSWPPEEERRYGSVEMREIKREAVAQHYCPNVQQWVMGVVLPPYA
jgi:hypothetical protein